MSRLTRPRAAARPGASNLMELRLLIAHGRSRPSEPRPSQPATRTECAFDGFLGLRHQVAFAGDERVDVAARRLEDQYVLSSRPRQLQERRHQQDHAAGNRHVLPLLEEGVDERRTAGHGRGDRQAVGLGRAADANAADRGDLIRGLPEIRDVPRNADVVLLEQKVLRHDAPLPAVRVYAAAGELSTRPAIVQEDPQDARLLHASRCSPRHERGGPTISMPYCAHARASSCACSGVGGPAGSGSPSRSAGRLNARTKRSKSSPHVTSASELPQGTRHDRCARCPSGR